MTNLSDINTSDSSTVEYYVYSGGEQGVSVEFYKVINGGHAWPADVSTGGTTNHVGTGPMYAGNRNMDFNASKEIWRFFRQYSLRTYTSPSFLAQPLAPTKTGINYQSNKNEITIYPNPSNGTFSLEVENYQNTSVKIINLLGKVLFEEDIKSPQTVITIDIPAGIYFYQVKNKTDIIKSAKLVVQ